uniref:Argonaut glycine-rich domain-containing protein n=1 Tax=Kalanchoe fedtschenkoi TaxID=63787 RepID=A0A7N0TVH1_KALFE
MKAVVLAVGDPDPFNNKLLTLLDIKLRTTTSTRWKRMGPSTTAPWRWWQGAGPSPGGPRSPVPELHQATPAPYQAVVTPQSLPSGQPADPGLF